MKLLNLEVFSFLIFTLAQGLCCELSSPKITLGKFGSVSLGAWMNNPRENIKLENVGHKLLISDSTDPQKGYIEYGKPKAIFAILNEKRFSFFWHGCSLRLLGTIRVGEDVEPILLLQMIEKSNRRQEIETDKNNTK